MYDIYGIKIADRDDVESSSVLSHTDPGKLIHTSYYFWCIKNINREFLVDTGMNKEELEKRNIYNLADQTERLRSIGVEPRNVKHIIITHLPGDHCSAFDLYPNATFYVQRREIEFFSSVQANNKDLIFGVGNIAEIVRLNYEGRVKIVDGDQEIAPGLLLILIGGHTPGCQAVVVEMSQGRAVLCSDACPLYRNMEENIPSGLNTNLVEAYYALDKLRKLASSEELVIPGHDPLLMKKFPVVTNGIIKIGES
jgi:glyoxylase-like metal-dependent hydrolase (beta-lactamase superfamily II)